MNVLSIVSQITIIAFFSSTSTFAQSVVEKTDSTITQIMYPEQDLKLWYGSDDFRVDNFVILPKHTLLYNKALSTFRLLDNQGNLIVDEVKVLAIKTIKPYIVVEQQREQKWALGLTTTWFTVLTDSTVMAGTALFSGRKEVAGYLMITVKSGKLNIVHNQFNLDRITDNIDPNNMQFITDYIDYKGIQLYSSMFVLSPTPKNTFVVKKSLYLKTAQKPLFLYLSQEDNVEEPPAKRQLIPIQLISTDDRLLIYDPKIEQLRVITSDIATPTLFDLTTSLPNNLPKGRKFGRAFMVDRVNDRLYYKTLAFTKENTDQLVMSVTLGRDKLTFEPVLRSNMSDYYSTYINNRKLFFYDSKRGYIYVTKTDLP